MKEESVHVLPKGVDARAYVDLNHEVTDQFPAKSTALLQGETVKTEEPLKIPSVEKPMKATETLTKAAVQSGVDVATALQAAATATAHQPGGHLYNQQED